MKNWLNKKFVTPILEQLKQGFTVEKISQSLAVGFAVAITPIMGIGTAICALLAIVFRLNHVVIQVANYAAYPIQLALIIPYLSYGQKLFSDEYKPLSLSDMTIEFAEKPIWFFETYGLIALKGAVLWILTAPIAGILVYFISLKLVRFVATRTSSL